MSEIVNMPSRAIEGSKWQSIYLAKWFDASSSGTPGRAINLLKPAPARQLIAARDRKIR
jgi:hypothetical protein